MRFLSLFSGLEAASLAWLELGWECAAVAEVDKFCCRLLAERYPGLLNLGDVTKITRKQIRALGQIDAVVFGFPCQDLSVAGHRKGLKDSDGKATRSGLFFDAARIADWSGARFTIVENVPGLFSSHKGRDFAVVVGTLAGVELDVPEDGWRNSGVCLGPRGLVEWCVLDAQYFGLAQRRNRVFFVRDSGDWASRPPLLFDAESMCRNPPPSREAGEGFTHDVAPCIDSSGCGFARTGDNRGQDPVIAMCLNGGGTRRLDGESETFVVAHALKAEGFDASEDGTGRGIPLVCATLTKNYANHYGRTAGNNGGIAEGQLIPVAQPNAVRRLTPLECERLQGFPDEYTKIAGAKDGPRYKAIGNSFPRPVMKWIGQRIVSFLTAPSGTGNAVGE